MPLLDLVRQVKNQLPIMFGGTGNKYGWGSGLVVPYFNVSGAAIPVGSIVQQAGNGGARMELCDTEDSTAMVGVLVGYYPNGDGNLIAIEECPDQSLGAVMVAGRCRVLVAENVAKDEYVYQSSTDGEAKGDATIGEGAFGIFESTGDSGNLAYIRLFGAPVFGAGGGASPLTTKGDLYGYSTADARIPVGTNGYVLTADSTDTEGIIWNYIRRGVLVEMNSPTAGLQADFVWPWDGTLVRWTLLADASGTATVDLWQDTYANYPPVVADTMVGGGGTKPNISGPALKGQGSPTSWTKTTFARGDTVRVNVDAVASIARLTLILEVTTP